MHQQRDPGHEAQSGHDGPLSERGAPSGDIRHRYCDEWWHERAHRHGRHVERGHQPDAVGEVPLHERWKQHVPDADRGERQRRCGDQPQRIARDAAPQQPDRERRERHDQGELEAEAFREQWRHDAEHGVAQRRQHAEEPDDQRGERDVALELGEDRRQ
jgi:hypothetical protein